MGVISDSGRCTTGPSGVGDAVGMAIRKWFIAIVNNNSEKIVQERLSRLNIESYVAKQTICRVWKNGKKAKVEKILVPTVVFVKCTEAERKEIVGLPYINRFMTNKARLGNGVSQPLAVVPQKEIDILRFMLGQSDVPVTITDAPYKIHDKVIVARGGLKGLEGEILEVVEGKGTVFVRMNVLGCARVLIDICDIMPIK